MAVPTASELAAPVVSKLLYLGAGMFVSIAVALVVAKLAPGQSRGARRALFSLVAFIGFGISWYLAFRPYTG